MHILARIGCMGTRRKRRRRLHHFESGASSADFRRRKIVSFVVREERLGVGMPTGFE